MLKVNPAKSDTIPCGDKAGIALQADRKRRGLIGPSFGSG